MVVRKVGRYEIGRTIGEGTFAKVKFAQNTETGESVAMKILDRATILKHKMVDQIKREITIMKLVRHPYVVRLHEVRQGRLSENESRRYFQQLIDGVDYCHSKGVYHRDLKVLSHNGYHGSVADVWSCGVILYVLLAGYLPFDEIDLSTLYGKIEKAEFSCPSWFPVGAKALICKILDPNPDTRISIEDIRNDEWFARNYTPAKNFECEDVNLDDVFAAFTDHEVQAFPEQQTNKSAGPLVLNAFDLIILSQGLNLSTLFDKSQDDVMHQTRFVTQKLPQVVLSSMEIVAQSMGFKTHIRNFKMRIEGLSANKVSRFSVILEVFEVAPTFFMVDVHKVAGDTVEYHKFYKNFCSNLEDIIWKPPEDGNGQKFWWQ
ncbi:unnamed protein product [Victoria cruziana]